MHGSGTPPQPPGPPGAPGAPGAPGGAYPGPTPPPVRAKTSPWVFVVGAVAAVLVLGAIAGSAVMNARQVGPTGMVKAGQCIGVRFDMEKKSSVQRVPVAERVDCDDEKAAGKVVQVVAESGGGVSAAPDCPGGADGVARVRTGEDAAGGRPTTVCARNIDGPHPGDPGAGGAMITVGDCVTSSIGFGGETPCTDEASYAKVVARVNSARECPSAALETMELKSFGGEAARPVLCLGGEGRIVSAGECVQDPKFAIGGLKTASCGSERAVAKVLARTRTKAECPKGTTHHLEAKEKEKVLRPIMCVKKLRPTFDERLNSLGG